MSKSYLNYPNLPRGIRNNNPGNLVKTNINWQGKLKSTDSRFEQFKDVKHGIRAKLRDILNDINKGKNTLSLLIHEYAPTTENNTSAYIKFLETHTQLVNVDLRTLNRTQLINLSYFIMIYENGWILQDYITKQDVSDAIDILGSISSFKNLKLNLNKSSSIFSNIAISLLTVFAFFF